MSNSSITLENLLDGWNGYQKSLVSAIAPLNSQQLAWRPKDNFRSIGELARHISLGRLTWLLCMHAPGSIALAEKVNDWKLDEDGNRDVIEEAIEIAEQSFLLAQWLNDSWQVIENCLKSWQPADLSQTYVHKWNGNFYNVSRQWTLWRILNHDLHHGGELSLMLGLHDIEAFELCALFGHTILPPLLC